MRHGSRAVWIAMVVGMVAMGTSHAQTAVRSGSIPEGSSGAGVANEIEREWNVSGFECQRQPKANFDPGSGTASLFVSQSEGACSNRELVLTFRIDSPTGRTTGDHTFDYQISCNGSTLSHAFALDGAPLQNIDDGLFQFGEIVILTAEFNVASVPTLGEWASIVATGLLALAGVFLVFRRFG